jgi:hypothetical protein
MTLTQQQIEDRLRKGVKLIGANGEPIALKPEPEKPKQTKTEIDYLRLIADLLLRQQGVLELAASKGQPVIPTPNFVVPEPKVIVQPHSPVTPPKPIRKWRFQVEKDHRGYTKEIIATAME